ncbi:hypothetical protein MNBD_GAMMA26-1178 [hydrothermal vent metagenome]|uniref:DUF306 domain-containing protein n=1 Tax=hydrothermal vent metagenome TaxID=652676 RepID=A0A3B1B0T4_9ZZZZ
MKYFTKYRAIGLFAVVIFFLLASCTSAPNIVEKWEAIGEPGTLEFHKDGSFEIVDNMGAVSKGNYVLGKNGDVKIVLTHSDIMRKNIQPVDVPEIVNGKLSVRGDELTFTSLDGKEVLQYKASQTNQ